MLRSVSMNEISDGKLYSSSDMVRADSLGCNGCYACCCHMGNSILLDPYDVYQMSQGLHVPAAALFNGQLQLTPVDGIILPTIAMTPDTDQCSFLNEAGRCTIHTFRPGFCRLFPLGRVYDGTGFSYFLQTDQCKKEHLSKVKVRQWINVPQLKRYEQFICDWHYFLKDAASASQGLSPELIKTLHSYILKTFYLTPYANADSVASTFLASLSNENVCPDIQDSFYDQFYNQFYARLKAAKELLL